ncbi:hypothetical protein [Streptomyces sp. NPDC093018]|uniref:hypothetical protein n=1 Tax=Streptomyces sp. NPDC093018 TaxID=3155067 RepID=UPI0034422F62
MEDEAAGRAPKPEFLKATGEAVYAGGKLSAIKGRTQPAVSSRTWTDFVKFAAHSA